jgi:ADP-heptose:LPS heptosyltransferase
MPEKLILRNFQSPGDILMLTAAVRDLHACHPGRFATDVRTSCPDLWLHNPYLTPLAEDDPEVRVVDCHYPLIHRSNQTPYHFIHGFIEYLNDTLGLQVKPTAFKGDVHLSAEEKAWFARVQEAKGEARPFWLLASGGKHDYTIKWWDHQRYQAVVDHFAGRIEFVQVGEAHHHHPPLRGAVDLRGQTTLRQLVRLMHHAQGAVSAVSLLMHLAAAVEPRPGMPKNRACVVIAGGREPPHFTAYPHHQFIHTVGALMCCDDGGCWKSRTRPLGDGDEKDLPENLCVDPVGDLPRCMHMITAETVIRRVETYFEGGALRYLDDPGV